MKRRDSFFNRDLFEFSNLFLLFLATLFILCFGTFGYMVIEGWNAFDSLYMTVTTLATVGFGEVHPLTDLGRGFTIILIFMGVGLVATLFSMVTTSIVEAQIFKNYREKRFMKEINQLNNHTIFCGYGRLTKIAAAELYEEGIELVIIDKDIEKCEEARNKGYLVVQGDSASEEILQKAGLNKAKRIACLLPKDSDNLYVILTSRELRNDIFILSRAEDDLSEKRLIRAGANKVIAPYRIGGHKVAEGILRPFVTDFLDLTTSDNEVSRDKTDGLLIEEIEVIRENFSSGKTLNESIGKMDVNVIIAAIIPKDRKMIFNPDWNSIIEVGSTLIAIGKKEDLRKLEEVLAVG